MWTFPLEGMRSELKFSSIYFSSYDANEILSTFRVSKTSDDCAVTDRQTRLPQFPTYRGQQQQEHQQCVQYCTVFRLYQVFEKRYKQQFIRLGVCDEACYQSVCRHLRVVLNVGPPLIL